MNAHLQRALAAIDLKRWALAQEALLLALGEQPNDAYIHALRAEVCYRQERYADARAAAREAIAADPAWSYGYYWLAWSHVSDPHSGHNRMQEANEAAKAALRCDPDNVENHYLHAMVARCEDNPGLTAEYAQAGLRINPESPGCLESLAWSQMAQQRDDEAVATLRQLLQHKPNSAYAHQHLASILLRQNHYAQAFDHASAAVRQNPNDREIRELFTEVVHHQNPVARVLLWSARVWEQYVAVFIFLGMAPLMLLIFTGDLPDPLSGLVTVLLFFLMGTIAFFGLIAAGIAKTVIAYSESMGALLPGSKARRTVIACGWLFMATLALALCLAALLQSVVPLVVAADAVLLGVFLLIGRRVSSRLVRVLIVLPIAIPLVTQIAIIANPTQFSLDETLIQPLMGSWAVATAVAFITRSFALKAEGATSG